MVSTQDDAKTNLVLGPKRGCCDTRVSEMHADGCPRKQTQNTVLKMLDGIGPDQPIVTNEFGGQQSEVPYRFDLLDSRAMFALASILHYGADIRGYPEGNWRLIPAKDNVNHALIHIMAWLDGDTQDKHLEHAFCRLMFALGVELQGGVKQ